MICIDDTPYILPTPFSHTVQVECVTHRSGLLVLAQYEQSGLHDSVHPLWRLVVAPHLCHRLLVHVQDGVVQAVQALLAVSLVPRLAQLILTTSQSQQNEHRSVIQQLWISQAVQALLAVSLVTLFTQLILVTS